MQKQFYKARECICYFEQREVGVKQTEEIMIKNIETRP